MKESGGTVFTIFYYTWVSSLHMRQLAEHSATRTADTCTYTPRVKMSINATGPISQAMEAASIDDNSDPFENVDLSKLPEELKEKLDMVKVEKILKEATSLRLLMTGRTGTGKSTLINGLLGMKMGDDDSAYESDGIGGPGQLRLQSHHRKRGRISVTVFDSRGLLDGTNESEQAKSLQEMVDKCSNVDFKFLCIDMSQKKFVLGNDDNLDIEAMQKLTKAFGESFWKNLMIILTFANKLEKRLSRPLHTDQHKTEAFINKLEEWERRICSALEEAGAPQEIAKSVKVVPAGHYDNWKLPDREYWLSDLWFECLDALPTLGAQGAFLYLNMNRLHRTSSISDSELTKPLHDQPLIITPELKVPKLKASANVIGFAIGGATTGASIALFTLVGGPIAVAVGVPAGALLGFAIGLALGVKRVHDEKNELNADWLVDQDQHRDLCQTSKPQPTTDDNSS